MEKCYLVSELEVILHKIDRIKKVPNPDYKHLKKLLTERDRLREQLNILDSDKKNG